MRPCWPQTPEYWDGTNDDIWLFEKFVAGGTQRATSNVFNGRCLPSPDTRSHQDLKFTN